MKLYRCIGVAILAAVAFLIPLPARALEPPRFDLEAALLRFSSARKAYRYALPARTDYDNIRPVGAGWYRGKDRA